MGHLGTWLFLLYIPSIIVASAIAGGGQVRSNISGRTSDGETFTASVATGEYVMPNPMLGKKTFTFMFILLLIIFTEFFFIGYEYLLTGKKITKFPNVDIVIWILSAILRLAVAGFLMKIIFRSERIKFIYSKIVFSLPISYIMFSVPEILKWLFKH
ncbi:MAG: hypothetical protein IPO37_02790 [Saprospiraceae bacterium]|nr:hypothetical protein [Saprospiraceae bacterium]